MHGMYAKQYITLALDTLKVHVIFCIISTM